MNPTGENKMKDLQEIKATLNEHLGVLKDNYSVSNLAVFGSYVRGEQTGNSDLDLLVEFIRPVSLFTLIDLEEYLSNILGIKVDVVPRDGIKPTFRDSIISEAVKV